MGITETLRRRINPYRRLNTEIVDEATATVKHTCRTCGHVWKDQLLIGYRGAKKPMSPAALRGMVKYWTGNQGCTGHCPKCTKAARDAKYPRKP